MNHRRFVRAAGIALAIELGLGGPLPEEPSAASLKELVSFRSTANGEEAASQKRVEALADRTEKLAHEYRTTLDNLEGLRIYNQQTEKLVESQEAEMASLESQIERVALVGRQLTPMMLEMVDALEELIALDVPFLPEERSRRIAELRAMMNRADVSDSEKYRRVLEAYQIENEYGRTIEAYTGALHLDGEERTVDFLRIGRVALLYQSTDGTLSGIWDPKAKAWAPLPSDSRAAILRGLRIARKQAAPDLLRVLVPAPEEVER